MSKDRRRNQGQGEDLSPAGLPSIDEVLGAATLHLNGDSTQKRYLVAPASEADDRSTGAEGSVSAEGAEERRTGDSKSTAAAGGRQLRACPCAHCGSGNGGVRREQVGSEKDRAGTSIEGASLWFYECGFCGARGPLGSDAREARRLWNGRRNLGEEESKRRVEEKSFFERRREEIESKARS